jgi:hypothetical protein
MCIEFEDALEEEEGDVEEMYIFEYVYILCIYSYKFMDIFNIHIYIFDL